MSGQIRERLYNLLPAIYRVRDAAEGEPLRALLAALEVEAQRIEADIAGLYENWFIETCEAWVVPYIAERLGIKSLPAVGGPGFNQRTHVANTLSYRRRKGTYSLLADLARDVTGFPVRVVEMFRLVATTQNVNGVRLGNLRTPDLRDAATLAKMGTPFDSIARTADVRGIDEGAVRHNLPNVAFFAFRLRSYRTENAPARAVSADEGRWTFSSLGDDIQLFNALRDDGASGEEGDLPLPLRGLLSTRRWRRLAKRRHWAFRRRTILISIESRARRRDRRRRCSAYRSMGRT